MNSPRKPGLEEANNSQASRRALTVFMLGLMAIGMGWVFYGLLPQKADFYNNLWGPVYLLTHGQSPYNTAGLNPTLPPMWFPMAIGFFFPLGWLPEPLATQVWFVFNILALCSLVVWAQGEKRSPFLLLALILFCFTFPPVLTHLYLGQISIVVVLSLMVAAWFMSRQKHWGAAAAMALALSKPHLVFLAAIGFCVYEYRREGWKAATGIAVKIALMVVLFCIPLFIADVNWMSDALTGMKQNTNWAYPSLFDIFQRVFPEWRYLLWGVVFAGILALDVFLWARLPMRDALLWSLALTPLASPFIWSWDFVLLLPLFLSTFVASSAKNRIALGVGYILAFVGMMLAQFHPGSHNQVFWWVPLWFVFLVAAITMREKSRPVTS